MYIMTQYHLSYECFVSGDKFGIEMIQKLALYNNEMLTFSVGTHCRPLWCFRGGLLCEYQENTE